MKANGYVCVVQWVTLVGPPVCRLILEVPSVSLASSALATKPLEDLQNAETTPSVLILDTDALLLTTSK
jgi:hypothetical protein